MCRVNDKALGKIYHEPNLCRSQGVRVVGILCLPLNNGRKIMPTYRCKNLPTMEDRHNIPPIFLKGNE
jgi:hypothetical protein